MAPLPPLTLTWVLCDHRGEPLPGGHVASNRRLIGGRNRFMEARLTLGMHDQAAIELFAVLANGIPQLRVYLGSVIVFSGHWTPMKGTNATDSPSTLDLVFRDAFHWLTYKYTDDSQIYPATDAGEIARHAIAVLAGSSGILTDLAWIEVTQPRDRTYNFKNVAELITELTEVIGGFDWYPVYLDPRPDGVQTMEFHVTSSVGADKPNAIFEFGDGTRNNCTSYSFTTSLPTNEVVAIGAGTPPIWEQVFDHPSRQKYFPYVAMLSATDVIEPATLIEKATDALRPDPTHVTEFKPDPVLSPLPWRDFWIGDTIRWNVDDGAMQQQLEPRVQTIEIGVDDSNNISDLTIGIDPDSSGGYSSPANTARRYVQGQRDLLRRLSALERL